MRHASNRVRGAIVISPGDLAALIEIVAALRDPEHGCPWDLCQTHVSLAPYALEEAYEVVDAIERNDGLDLRDELGDLLLQVVLHARLAEEAGAFSLDDVVEAIGTKMVRRHPHVFERALDPSCATNADSMPTAKTWDAVKAEERSAKQGARATVGLLDDVTIALPGLTRAVKLQTRASTVGFDWHDARTVLAKIEEETREIGQALDEGSMEAVTDEIGDLLFAVANLARHAGVDPEQAVRGTNAKFTRRFAYIEQALREKGRPMASATLAEMDGLWDEAKAAGL